MRSLLCRRKASEQDEEELKERYADRKERSRELQVILSEDRKILDKTVRTMRRKV